MSQTQLQKVNGDGNDGQTTLSAEQGSQSGSSVVQDIVSDHEIHNFKVNLVDQLNEAVGQVDQQIQNDRKAGNLVGFAVDSVDGAIKAVMDQHRLSRHRAVLHLYQTDIVQKNRELFLLLKPEKERAEAFDKIRSSLKRILVSPLRGITTRLVVNVANTLEKVANIGETLRIKKEEKVQKKLEKQKEKENQEKAELERRKAVDLWGRRYSIIENAINSLSVIYFKVEEGEPLFGGNEISLKKVFEYPHRSYTSKEEDDNTSRVMGPQIKYAKEDFKSGLKLEVLLNNYKEAWKTYPERGSKKHLYSPIIGDYSFNVDVVVTFKLPPNHVLITCRNGGNDLRRFSADNPGEQASFPFDLNKRDFDRFFVIKIKENGSYTIVESYKIGEIKPVKDY